jgi:hypothetical protein
MFRVDYIYEKHESNYQLDAVAATRLAKGLLREPGVTVLLLNIYNDEGKLIYRLGDKEMLSAKDAS